MPPTGTAPSDFRRGRPPGRPTKVDQIIATREVHDADGNVTCTVDVTVADRIVEHLLHGSYLETAAAAAGVARETLNTWLREAADAGAKAAIGDRITSRQRRLIAFSDAIDQAMAQAEQDDLARLDVLADGPDKTVAFRAVIWRMERRRSRRWGPKASLELTGPDGGPIVVDTADARSVIERELDRIEQRLAAPIAPPAPPEPDPAG